MTRATNRPVLCVDLDGTLVRTDLLAEALILLVKQNPILLLMLPIWLCVGRAYLKSRVAEVVKFDFARLPYDERLLEYLRRERDRGRALALVTASPRLWATGVEQHLGLFDFVYASNTHLNLKGIRKAKLLSSIYGVRGFSYAGDSRADIPVWCAAQSAVLVRVSQSISSKIRPHTRIEFTVPDSTSRMKSVIASLRPHQWAKNLLLLVPLVAAHKLQDLSAIGHLAIAMVAMCCMASAAYLFNDLLDIESDRLHRSKRFRSLAAGTVSIWVAMTLVPVLLLAGTLVGSMLPRAFLVGLATYVVATTAYSLWIKKHVVADVILLAGVYMLRVILGGLAIEIPLSAWLLAFATFLFLGLALMKRYSELRAVSADGTVVVRGYQVADTPLIGVFGVASGYISILVLALYINSPEVTKLYSRPIWLWGLCPMFLYWVSYAWLKAFRGEMMDDPVVYALRSPSTYVVGASLVAFMFLAT